jgi:hypothetical protein
VLERLIEKLSGTLSIEQIFDEDTLTLTIVTRLGHKVVHEHTTDMTPMFDAFKKRMKKK